MNNFTRRDEIGFDEEMLSTLQRIFKYSNVAEKFLRKKKYICSNIILRYVELNLIWYRSKAKKNRQIV